MRAVYPSLARQAVFIAGGASGIGAAFVRDRIRVNRILPGWVVTDKPLDQWLDEKTGQAWMHTVCLAE
jgi:NAD(P)-dependent dehydrogenase (short-subunit alcohol dehydrogenase family)